MKNQKWFNYLASATLSFALISCSSFKAERLDSKASDEKAMTITDKWLEQDTTNVIKEVLSQIDKHKGFKRYLSKKRKTPKVFVGEVQNMTSEAYFPIHDINDELLTEFSASGDFILIDAEARE